ncbi:hypothetical protein EC988_003470 [Linderina pennispora]|nr:hypothetical protein EC988_003470 [Linderina pennispora]
MALAPEQQPAAVEPLISLVIERLHSDVALLESVPRGTSFTDLEPYWTPLLDHLNLVDSLARGLEFADDIEERALMGDPEEVDILVQAAHCYEGSAGLQEFRRSLLALMNHVVASEVWRVGHQDVDIKLMPDVLLECLLSIVNSISRRGPHAFELPFGQVTSLIGEAWSGLVVMQSTGSTVYAQRWIEQCPMFLQSISQLIKVFTGKVNPWQPTRPGADETDRIFGAILTRVLDDTILGIAREADDVVTAVDQLPNVNEAVFDLCTQSLQTRPNLFVHISSPALARICELSAQALSIPNRLALKPTAYFLTALTRLSNESQSEGPVKQLFHMLWRQYGQTWLQTAVGGIGGTHPRSLLANLSELLFAMVKNNPTMTRTWMSELLARQGFPSAHVNDKEKQLFLQQAVSTRSYSRFKTVVTEFSIRCRNLQGTAYIT